MRERTVSAPTLHVEMIADPENLLDPDAGLMAWTLLAVTGTAVVITCVMLGLWALHRARRPRVVDGTQGSLGPVVEGLQEQVDTLTARVHELTEANRFLEQLVAERHALPGADSHSHSGS